MLRPESAQEQRFRAQVRGWLETNLAPELRFLTFRPPPEVIMPWYRRLAQRGWIAPHWPRAWGGMEASPVEEVILMEELARAGAPDIPSQGLNHIGPILMKFGTSEQQQRHLPPIVAGDVIWCQGYSEPGAGSDLAALSTRAERRADKLVISGHKIWTTWGHHAHWMFALVRTSSGASRRDGISFVLIDLSTPGITRRPIRTIAGDDEFCEVFFDQVPVPFANVVGELDRGWQVATALLAEERLRVAAPLQALRALRRLHALADATGARDDPELAARIAEVEIETETLTAAYLDAAEAQAHGRPADSSYLKILATETVQRILDLLQEIAGERRALRQPLRAGARVLDFSEMFLQARRLSIYAGSNEIQRSIIATRILGMGGPGRKE
jgi:alkylation response protein AidB-like acyl-CoA dehydrogenase